jgi:D-alanyl-D-alanine carboxypeptidase
MMVIILALFASFFLMESYRATKELIEKEKKEEELRIQKEKFVDTLKVLDLKAKAVSVYDITSRERVYKLNDDVVLPLASLAKTMTAMVVLDNQKENHLIKITKNDLKEEGEYGLKEGDEWNLLELLKFTLVYSSNDGASAMSREVPDFVNKMNEKAQIIGLNKTHFSNATGLDENKEKSISGAYGTAFEANKMAVHAFENYAEVFFFYDDTNFKNEIKIIYL